MSDYIHCCLSYRIS